MPHVAPFDAFVEIGRFCFEWHGTPFDERNALIGANPRLPVIHLDVADVVIEQPAAAEEILPTIPSEVRPRIKARRPIVAAEPDDAGFLASEDFQSLDRAAFWIFPRRAARLGADFGGHPGVPDGKVAGEFLGLPNGDRSRQHHTGNPGHAAS